MDALTLLIEDHERFRDLLSRLAKTDRADAETREALFAELVEGLTVHENVEEEVFYPALKEHPKAASDVLEGYEEHHVADEVVADIEDTPYDAEDWGPKLKVLKETVEHHIGEEERELFAKARDLFSVDALEELGARMRELKLEQLEALEEEQA